MTKSPQQWWDRQVSNVRAALDLRRQHRAPTRVVVSVIRQDAIEGKLQEAVDFWLKEIGVDEVITRKFLTWDDNTTIPSGKALDKHLYADMPTEKKQPCVWPFERLNVDTLGRISLCGQDISFRTSELFPTPMKPQSGNLERRHVQLVSSDAPSGRGAECFPAGLPLVRRHSRLGTRLAESAQEIRRSSKAGVERRSGRK